MISLSPSIAFGCVELLGAVTRNALTPGGVASLSLGSVSAHLIYDAAVALQWVELGQDGFLSPTVRGERVVQERDGRVRLRALVFDYIEIEQPPWLQLAPAGRRETLLQAPVGLRQILSEAGLAYGEDDETIAFWDSLAARARGIRDSAMSEIGRRGERLTIARELERTGATPKWVALESSTDGYDVLSRISSCDTRRMTIEVKASERPRSFAVLHLTRNEWETAETSLCHQFHLWDLSSMPPLLASLNVDELRDHVPANRGKGSWEATTVPFAAFASSFSA